ncbi:hypothetical protein [Mesorhizobium sp. M0276]|uniref:hypothetical protein n=1 Tax=Mesorhizobium sp. M0276 TaxID=2956928 RepID=UPI0033397576
MTLLSFMPVAFPATIGPLATLSVAVGLLGMLASFAATYPKLSASYLVVCVVASFLGGPQRAVPLFDPALYAQHPAYATLDGLYQWLNARGDLDAYRKARHPYPVIISSAEGGGMYAAAHAYLALSAMQGVCPNFAQHLFASVGVSGGSIGQLLFSASLDANKENTVLKPCHRRTVSIPTAPVTTDLLSPVFANLLIVGTADFLIPGRQVFTDSGTALTDAVLTTLPGNEFLSAPLRASWSPKENRPVLVFVSTNVNDGNRFVFSALDNLGAETAESFPSGNIVSARDIGTATAAVISARFPWVTDSARLQVSDNSFRVLADGGYYENSGADTALEIVQQIRGLAAQTQTAGCTYQVTGGDACKCQLYVLTKFDTPVDWQGCNSYIFLAYVPIAGLVENKPGYVYGDTPDPSQSLIADPLSTMLAARSARGVIALARAEAYFGGFDDPTFAGGNDADSGYFENALPADALRLPLGWKLSQTAVDDMLNLAAPTEACEVPTNTGVPISKVGTTETETVPSDDSGLPIDPDLKQVARHDNGCSMATLAWLFDPAHHPGQYAIVGW